MRADALSGRLVLITGGLGFIGLNLVGPLLDRGSRVRILSRLQDPLASSWLSRVAASRPVEVEEADIRDVSRLTHWLDDVDVIVNLAGESGALRSLQDARTDAEVNVIGHLRLLDAIQQRRVLPRLVFLSSRLVYGVTGRAAVGEDHSTVPSSVYGLHKLTVEHYHRLYWHHYGVPYCVLRVTNAYGPYQLPHRHTHGLVNQFVLSALAGQQLTIFGDGNQLRDYVHVSDVASAIIAAATNRRAVGATFNVGAGSSVRLIEVAHWIARLVGKGTVNLMPWPADLLGVETGDFVCDTSRVREQLGWHPQIDFEEGLTATISKYRELLEC